VLRDECSIVPPTTLSRAELSDAAYVLDDQVGFVLRQAYQRHAAIFAERFGDDLTPTQWAAVAKLAEIGDCSQNLLGRYTAMDVATIKGVVERLARRGLVRTQADPEDRRRLMVSLSEEGRALYEERQAVAHAVTAETLAPLKAQEQATLLRLLARLR
jgi:DNA-binding MarR family transcriptional regulator